MRNELKNTNIRKYVLSYTFLFVLVSVIIFCPFILNNVSLVWNSDAAGQYAPNLYFLYQNIENLINGNMNQAFTQYSFTSGLGGDVISLYGKGVWEIIFAVLGKENIQVVIAVLILVRIYEAGLSFSVLAYYLKFESIPILIGSFIYAFSGYTFLYCTRHYSFLIAMVLLPLLVLSVEKIMRRESEWLFLLCIAYQAWTDFYFLYINTLLLGVYVIIRWTDGRTVQEILKDAIHIGRDYLFACLLAAPMLFVRGDRLLNCSRGGTKTVESGNLLFYSKTWIQEFFVRLISPYSSNDYTKYYMLYGVAGLVILGVLGVIFNKKSNRKLIKLFFASTLFLLFPIFAYIFSGFNSLVNRWSYAYVLVLAFCVTAELPNLVYKNDKVLYSMTLVVVGYLVTVKTTETLDERSSYLGLVILSVLLLLYILINYVVVDKIKINTKYRIYALCVLINICINGLFIYSDWGYGFKNEFVTDGQFKENYENTSFAVGNEIYDEDFYRIETDDYRQNTANASKVFGEYGTHTYDSMMPDDIIDFNTRLNNIAQKTSGNLYGFDLRARLESLAGVKYYITADSESESVPFGFFEYKKCKNDNGADRTIYKNKHHIPLMYTYDSVISQQEVSDISDLELEHLMLKAAIVSDDQPVHIPKAKKVNDNGIEEIDYSFGVDSGIQVSEGTIEVEEANKSLRMTFVSPSNSEMYLRINGLNIDEVSPKSFSIGVSNKDGKFTNIWVFNSLDKYRTKNFQDYLINLGYFEDQSTHVCTITFPKAGKYHFDDIMLQTSHMDDYISSIENLKDNNTLNDVVLGRDRINANMSINDSRIVCTTIPYSKFWTVYIDDEKIKSEKINYMWLGFEMPKGTHVIKMKYNNWWFKIGCCCSFFSVCCILLYLLMRKWRYGKN